MNVSRQRWCIPVFGAAFFAVQGCACGTGGPGTITAPTPDGPAADRVMADREVPPDNEGCDPVDATSCRFDPSIDLMLLGEDAVFEVKQIGVAASNGNFGVVYTHRAEDGGEQIFLSRIGSQGAPQHGRLTGGFYVHRDPAIVATETGWLAAFSANYDGNLEVYSRTYDSNGQAVSQLNRISTDAAQALFADQSVSLSHGADGTLVSWVRVGTASRTGLVGRLNADGSLAGPAQEIAAGDAPMTVPRAASRNGGFILGWANSYSTSLRAAMAMPVSTSGELGSIDAISQTGSTLLSAEVTGPVDFALDDREGVVVYGVNRGVERLIRGRRLEPSATINQTFSREHQSDVVGEEGWDVSVARYFGGYVIAYRSLSTGNSRSQVRIAFMQSNFHVVRTLDLATSEDSGGQVRVGFSNGVVMVAWADASTQSGTQVRAARVICDAS